MLIEAQKIINLPVASLETLSKIGEIKQIVIEPTGGKVLGFLVQTPGFFMPKLILSIIDVAEWDPKGLITETEDNLVPPQEIVRAYELVKQDFYLLGLAAYNQENEKLGNLDNFLIDTENEQVVKFYINDIFGNLRIFPREKVIKITKEKITFHTENTQKAVQEPKLAQG